jgi:hypothetical protein
MQGLIEWWSELPAWLRYGVAILFIGISTALYFFADRFWPWGWGIGLALLIFAGPSDSEKKGYRF